MRLSDITSETIQKVSNQELLGLHQRTHQLFSLAKKSNNQNLLKLVKKSHTIIVNEMKRRGMNHKSDIIDRLHEALNEAENDTNSVLKSVKAKFDALVSRFKTKANQEEEKIKEEYKQKKKDTLANLEKLLRDGQLSREQYVHDRDSAIKNLELIMLSKLDRHRTAVDQYTTILKNQKHHETNAVLTKSEKLDKFVTDKIKKVKSTKKQRMLAKSIIMLGYKLYKDHFSNASKECHNKYGLDKDKCMNKARHEAMKRRIAFIQSEKHKCDISKNPTLCKRNIDDHLNSLTKRLSDYIRM